MFLEELLLRAFGPIPMNVLFSGPGWVRKFVYIRALLGLRSFENPLPLVYVAVV